MFNHFCVGGDIAGVRLPLGEVHQPSPRLGGKHVAEQEDEALLLVETQTLEVQGSVVHQGPV